MSAVAPVTGLSAVSYTWPSSVNVTLLGVAGVCVGAARVAGLLHAAATKTPAMMARFVRFGISSSSSPSTRVAATTPVAAKRQKGLAYERLQARETHRA